MTAGIPRDVFKQSMRRAVRALCIRQAVIASPDDPAFSEIWDQYLMDLDESLELAGVDLGPRPAEREGTESTSGQEAGQDAPISLLH